ncbi:MAG TPA: LysR family transcriptional regulator [Sphingobium sp.]|nr:LysR family transcriptional regulator [Sphingobium sp.]
MLDRYLLRYFLAVVDQGNFSRAAAHCNVSQPTLSVGIAKLERTLGTALFVRTNQRVEMTAAGSRFLLHARKIEREFNLAIRLMSPADHPASLRLGVLGSVPSALVAAAVAETRPTQDYRFELIFGSERELISHLAKGRIDIALTLVQRGGDRFLEKPVCTEGYALAMPLDHPLAQEKSISAEDLANEVMIVRRHCEALSETSRHFTERGVRPHFALRSTNDERVLNLVAAGLGITVMPLSYRQEGIVRPLLTGFDLKRTLGWAASAEAEHLLSAPPPLFKAIEQQLAITQP